MNDAYRLIEAAGYLTHLHNVTCDGGTIRAQADPVLISKLRGDLRFRKSWLHHLHVRIPKPRIEFRSFHGEIDSDFECSVQIVFCKIASADGLCPMEADTDANNPNQDVRRFIGHTVDVISNFWRRMTNA